MGRATRLTLLIAVLLAFAVGVVACGSDGESGSESSSASGSKGDTPPTPATESEVGFTPAAPEPGTEIPKVDATFGMRPYADNSFLMIAMEQGWFEESGILVKPAPYGIKNSDNAVAMMLKKQVDIQAMFAPTMIPTMKNDDSLKQIALTHLFGGWAIFANPDLGLKTVGEHMKEGLEFEEAMKATLEPLAGQDLVVAPLVDARGFTRLSFEIAGVEQPKLQVLDDAKSLVLAKSKRVKFAVPTGAPITLSFQKLGYKPLVTPFDILDNMPGDPKGAHELLVQNVGLASNDEYINENPNTILRTLGVTWRTLDAIKKDPETQLSLYTPYLNSVAGTELGWEDIDGLFNGLTPMIQFEDMPDYCADQEGTLYYKNAYGAILGDYVKQGLISDEFKPDDLIWACQVYETASWYKDQAEQQLSGLEGGSVPADKQELVTKAKELLAQFNFLDAYRYAVAASE
jgi:ABC-type nitrate/sulfonate/bicarbonate transport system substrate-binding protein